MVAYPAGDYRQRLKNAAGDLNSSLVVSLGNFTSDIKKNFYVASVGDKVTAND
jgi:uncharacterized protein (UPF0218 family)